MNWFSKKQERDPVCGMNVNDLQITSEHNGKTYYFCSALCKTQFDANPNNYLGKSTLRSGCGCCH